MFKEPVVKSLIVNGLVVHASEDLAEIDSIARHLKSAAPELDVATQVTEIHAAERVASS